jgi:hypothetical protein
VRLRLEGSQPGQVAGPHLQNNKSKRWTKADALWIDYLLCKHEALSSNSSPPQKKLTGMLKGMNISEKEVGFVF